MKFAEPTENCPICSSRIQQTFPTDRDIYQYRCPICGRVNITAEAVISFASEAKGLNHLVSGFTRERTELGLQPIDILSTDISELLSGVNIPGNVSEKLDRLLLYLERKSDFAGKLVQIDSSTMYSIAYAKNQREFDFLIDQLKALEYIEVSSTTNPRQVLLTLNGWNRIVELHRTPRNSNQAFIAMWFTPETQKAYDDGIEKAVSECGFKPIRVDKLEHNNKICDVIVAEIRRSAFLVADFTGQRGGVYFEAGYAMGLGIPVIWLCHKDHIDSTHFDTRQYNHIVWENETELHQRLLNRIRATIIH
jgi:nucleoside 2-deoxyribosyltransferase